MRIIVDIARSSREICGLDLVLELFELNSCHRRGHTLVTITMAAAARRLRHVLSCAAAGSTVSVVDDEVP